MEQKRYTIEELCELSGYTRRTVRYYIQEGLLGPPAGRGRGGFYFDSHLKRLSEIRALQEIGLKLSDIASHLESGEKPAAPARREIWIRYPLADGVEIQIRRDVEEEKRKKIGALLRAARTILEGGQG